MLYTTLITPAELLPHLDDPHWVIVDCRYSLNEEERGRQDYLEGHIPSAIFVHLKEDLASTAIPGRTGRHPLPPPDTFAQTVSRWGVDAQTQVVAYDDSG